MGQMTYQQYQSTEGSGGRND